MQAHIAEHRHSLTQRMPPTFVAFFFFFSNLKIEFFQAIHVPVYAGFLPNIVDASSNSSAAATSDDVGDGRGDRNSAVFQPRRHSWHEERVCEDRGGRREVIDFSTVLKREF